MCISHEKKGDEELKAVIRAYLSAKIVTVCSSNMQGDNFEIFLDGQYDLTWLQISRVTFAKEI